jgi:hypothetical protein
VNDRQPCAECGARRRRIELLRVTDIGSGRERYICRPTIDPCCFTVNVEWAGIDRIEAAA